MGQKPGLGSCNEVLYERLYVYLPQILCLPSRLTTPSSLLASRHLMKPWQQRNPLYWISEPGAPGKPEAAPEPGEHLLGGMYLKASYTKS